LIWQMRKSIRPINLRRIIELASIAIDEGKITENLVSKKLNTSQKQARELLRELSRMNLLKVELEYFIPTEKSREILYYYERENWEGIHNFLFMNYDFYNIFITKLSKGPPRLKDELLNELSHIEDIVYNNTAIDILCDWAERLGQVQRNLYNNKYYLLRKEEITHQHFLKVIEECYSNLNVKTRPGIKIIYVEIARLRELVCEYLKIKRDIFDKFLEHLFLKNIGRMELSGAPLTTSAKKSPTSLKFLERGEKENILSPQYKTIREGRGLEVNGKLYHYIGIFGKLG